MNFKNKKHIFFDLDHTLWDFDKNSSFTFKKLFNLYDININLKSFLKVYEPINLKYWKLYREDKIDKVNLRFFRLKDTFDVLEIDISDSIINDLSDDYIKFLPTFNYLIMGSLDILKYLHPKYAPANRYARDIIGCLNNWVDGWIDWNMVLDRQGGPNWFKNWCVAPVIVDPEVNQVYYTPLYYIMSHFSKFIRPGAEIIGVENNDSDLMVAAAQNPDNSISVVVFNEGLSAKTFELSYSKLKKIITIAPQAIQTIHIQD